MSSPVPQPLTLKQQRFCYEYLKDGNAAAAAGRAGYGDQHRAAWGRSLSALPQVRAELDRLRAKMAQKTEITLERVVEEYRRLAFADARTLHHPDGRLKGPQDWDDDTAAQIAGIELTQTRTTATSASTTGSITDTTAHIEERTVKVRRWDKIKALDRLATYVGMDRPDPDATRISVQDLDLDRLSDDDLAEVYALTQRLSSLGTRKP
jgi:phage terminase small subunit